MDVSDVAKTAEAFLKIASVYKEENDEVKTAVLDSIGETFFCICWFDCSLAVNMFIDQKEAFVFNYTQKVLSFKIFSYVLLNLLKETWNYTMNQSHHDLFMSKFRSFVAMHRGQIEKATQSRLYTEGLVQHSFASMLAK